MAHTYYGDDGLILTSITKENFDSGLSRVDCIYKCRTTKADALETTLAQGFRVPDRTSYIIRENAKRKDDTDGFTTFTVSGYFGSLVTAPNATNPIPSILGANVGSTRLTVTTAQGIQGQATNVRTIYDLQILSDTLTRKFTMRKEDSVADLLLPEIKLNANVLVAVVADVAGNRNVGARYTLQELENYLAGTTTRTEQDAGARIVEYTTTSTYIRGTIKNRLVTIPEIINVNRSGFGDFDEVTVTWGCKFTPISVEFVKIEVSSLHI